MKSTQRPSKPPKVKPTDPNPKLDQAPDENHPRQELTLDTEPVTEKVGEAIAPVEWKPKPIKRSQSADGERFQHMRFLDCDKPVGRIVFECYHCQQGILSEFTGEPVMGEYRGRPSVIEIKVKCPSCGETAIRLTTGEVLSVSAIASPWAE